MLLVLASLPSSISQSHEFNRGLRFPESHLNTTRTPISGVAVDTGVGSGGWLSMFPVSVGTSAGKVPVGITDGVGGKLFEGGDGYVGKLGPEFGNWFPEFLFVSAGGVTVGLV